MRYIRRFIGNISGTDSEHSRKIVENNFNKATEGEEQSNVDNIYLVAGSMLPHYNMDDIKYIWNLSIFPRRLVNPLSWLIVWDCASFYGVHHNEFPPKDIPITDEEFINYAINNRLISNLANLARIASRITDMKLPIQYDNKLKLNPVGVRGNIFYSPVDSGQGVFFDGEWFDFHSYGKKYPGGYGNLSYKYHTGCDLNLPNNRDLGHVVKAQTGGIVKVLREAMSLENLVTIEDVTINGKQWRIRNAHLDEVYVHDGQKVVANQALGTIGTSNGKWSAHLHTDVILQALSITNTTAYTDMAKMLQETIDPYDLYRM